MTADGCQPYSPELLAQTKIPEMYEVAIQMISNTLESFAKEDSKLVRSVFKNDEVLDKVNKHANAVIAKLIKENPEEVGKLFRAFVDYSKTRTSGRSN